MKKILIYDDLPGFMGQLKECLESLAIVTDAFEINTLNEKDFEDSLKTLQKRQRTFRETGTWNTELIPVDDAAIFIVDYDLFETEPFLTGEALAYSARCFSRCGLIVGVNQYGHNTFDLTLKGYPESFADLNVGQEQLDNPSLWGGTITGFHPWHWPVLPNYLDDFDRKVEDVEESLGEIPKDDIPIHQVLGIPDEIFEMLPRSIGQFLGKEPAKTTFRQFVVDSGNGLRLKDSQTEGISREMVARVGAARISKWLERLVLPGQDILIDAPHLVSRYPSLITGDVEDIETWNKTTWLTNHVELGLSRELIERFRSKKDHWLSRPVWFWNDLRECEEVLEVREPWKLKRPNWVFCEDASQFCAERYREFVMDTESPFSRRFVREFEDVDYRPMYRFSL